MEAFWTNFVNMVDGWKLIVVFIAIGIDFVLGCIVAWKNHEFQLSQIGRFLNTSVLYLLAGYALVGAFAAVSDSIGEEVVFATWALIDATMLGSIIAKAKQLGMPFPDKVGFVKLTK